MANTKMLIEQERKTGTATTLAAAAAAKTATVGARREKNAIPSFEAKI